MRLQQPDRPLEAALIGAWDQYHAGRAIGKIELFSDYTYSERSYPASAFTKMIYREFGGQEWSGPWYVSTEKYGASHPALHLHLHAMAFLGLGLL